MRYTIMLSPREFGEKPTKNQIAEISDSFEPAQVTIPELAQAISRGQTWSGCLWYGRRVVENFVQLSLVYVDLDHGNFSLEDILSTGPEPALVHETFSSTPGDRRWRVVYALPEPIHDAGTARAVLQQFCQLHGGDPAVASLVRALYGTNRGIAYTSDAVVTPEPVPHSETLGGYRISEPEGDQTRLIMNLPPRKRAILKLVLEDVEQILQNPRETVGSRYTGAFLAGLKLGQISVLKTDTIVQIVSDGISQGVWLEPSKHDYLEVALKGVNWARAGRGRF